MTSSRMHSCVTINLTESDHTVRMTHRCDGTISCDRERGEVSCRDTGPPGQAIGGAGMAGAHSNRAAQHSTDDRLGRLRCEGRCGIIPVIRELFMDLMVGLFSALHTLLGAAPTN